MQVFLPLFFMFFVLFFRPKNKGFNNAGLLSDNPALSENKAGFLKHRIPASWRLCRLQQEVCQVGVGRVFLKPV
jgi:hypothetical protein